MSRAFVLVVVAVAVLLATGGLAVQWGASTDPDARTVQTPAPCGAGEGGQRDANSPGITIIFQPVAGLPAWEAEDGEFVATTQTEFNNLLAQYRTSPNFVGTIIVTDNPEPIGEWPPAGGFSHLRFRFRDVPAYQDWIVRMEGGWEPGYLDELEADPPPPPEEAIFDLDQWSAIDQATIQVIVARVRTSDGASGVLSAETFPWAEPLPPDPEPHGEGGEPPERGHSECNAGLWWQFNQTCCHVQRFMCVTLARWLVCPHRPNAACCQSGGCTSCFNNCMNCSVSNPCHSCGRCGLMQFFCRFFGHC